jgi:ketosteroid isomerase-like protein
MKNRAVFIVISLTVAVLLGATAMAQSTTEKEIGDLEQKMNASYAANDLPTYFAYYSPDFTQWLPEGRTDLPQYEKMWTAFIKSGGRVESGQISDMHVQIDPSGDTAVASYLLRVKTRSAKGEVPDEEFKRRTFGSSVMGCGKSCTCTIHPRQRKNKIPPDAFGAFHEQFV